MPSFISNSKQDLKALAVVLVLLVLGELAFRLAGSRFSEEFRVADGIPSRARALDDSEGVRCLVIGNSLAIYGFDETVFGQECESSGVGPVAVQKELFRGSGELEWYYLLKCHLSYASRAPAVLVMPFNTKSVVDQTEIRVGRLGTFIRARDLPEAGLGSDFSMDEKISLMVSMVLRSYAGRDKIRELVLQRVVPYYTYGERQVFASQPASEKADSQEAGQTARFTFKGIGRILALAKRHSIKTFFVAMPAAGEYEIPADLESAIVKGGGHLLDLRHMDEITAKDFRGDGVHLNEAGARIVTSAIAASMSRALVYDPPK